ncbi:hypothetical protein GIB67_023712 [Kingdonia uniflora]|uniref:Aminotransferase-like plant mobile domain-containing protein n=1 Tax=Kingdonia uniflora TaxID=39325 RepID=A0A7J7MG94_9MAGN|nr:hypothetical protein GIB67_023712 [Kingdonia uniflora]
MVQGLVKLKGLDRIEAISYDYYNSGLISDFAGRWQLETNSFYFKWGEMTPTLDDVEQLIGFGTDGDVTVIGGTWGFPTLLNNFQNNLLQDFDGFKTLKAGCKGNSLSLRKLREHYAYKLEKVISDGTTAVAKKKGLTTMSVDRAFMLYVLGSFLYPTKKGTDVSARYLDLFAMDKVSKKWSWGSAVLMHIYYNLSATSRDDGRQFACCTTLLESWIFAYFPKLPGIPKELDSDNYEHYTCWKWGGSVTDRNGGPTLLKFKETLDNYKVEDKKWKEWVLKKAEMGQRVREGPSVCTEGYSEWFAIISWTRICPITVDLATDDDVGLFRIHRRKEACVNEEGDTPVNQCEDVGEQYDELLNEHATLSPNAHDTMPIRGESGGFDKYLFCHAVEGSEKIESRMPSANNDIISELAAMGFNYLHCQKAAINTSNAGLMEATNWLLHYAEDSDINDPISQTDHQTG